VNNFAKEKTQKISLKKVINIFYLWWPILISPILQIKAAQNKKLRHFDKSKVTEVNVFT